MNGEKRLGRRQDLVIFLCWLAYTCVYFGRYSYHANINAVMAENGVTHAAAGLVSTFFFISYGVGQVVHGLLSARYPKRLLFPLVLGFSAALNLAVYFGAPFSSYKYLWFLNGAATSAMWSSLILVLSENLDARHLKRAILLMGTTTSGGTFATYGLASLFSAYFDYKLSFLVGASILIAVGAVWFFLYRPTGYVPEKAAPASLPGKKKSSPAKAVLAIVAVFCVLAAADNFVKDGLATWVPSILKETYGLTDGASLGITTFLTLVGLLTAPLTLAANRAVKDLTSLATLFFGAAAILTGAILALMRVSFWPVVVIFGTVMLLMHMINNVLTSMGPLYMRGRIHSGKMSGVVNGACYVGSAASSFGLGLFADRFGWRPVFLLFAGVLAAMTLFGAAARLIFKRTETSENNGKNKKEVAP